MKHPVAIVILSSFLLFLFGYTAIHKLMDLEGFRYSLRQIPLVGMGAGVLALATPLAELVIVLLLFFSSTRLKGLYASAGLLTLFTIYLVAMQFLPEKPCRCGGVINGMGWWEHVVMNGLLVGISVMGIRKLKRGKEASGQ